jgi:hypothetical protein
MASHTVLARLAHYSCKFGQIFLMGLANVASLPSFTNDKNFGECEFGEYHDMLFLANASLAGLNISCCAHFELARLAKLAGLARLARLARLAKLSILRSLQISHESTMFKRLNVHVVDCCTHFIFT